ncbi:MAG: response regulator transcription factor [Candidatus Eremiobacteraeota bacterium]|nr:response regulator transcription factor [Candidatus Eremiobacteraeota bacterium]MCW5870484.1 response regulator transcription factor [Candidatus Eremiobacteraeota bacterium]
MISERIRTANVLVVEDDWPIRHLLKVSLSAHAYEVSEAETCKEAFTSLAKQVPDLLLLDLGLPDGSGIELLRRLRQEHAIPVIILSVQGAETTKIEALDLGADDYLTKPFSVDELLARVRAALRRSKSLHAPTLLTCGDLELDLERRHVTLAGHEISLTPNEFSLLMAFMRNQDRVLTHRQLLKEVWGEGYVDDSHVLRVNVCNLRRKLNSPDGKRNYIKTEPGVGYRLCLPRPA